MKNALVCISGIGKKAYIVEQLRKISGGSKLLSEYDEVFEIEYQPIMDQHALVGKTILDPLRLMTSWSGMKAQKFVREQLKEYCQNYKVDLLTHSLGSWLAVKCPVDVDTFVCLANPAGWFSPVTRKLVQLNIGKPAISAKESYFFYSSKDLVGNKFPEGYDKIGSEINFKVNTYTSHDFKEYMELVLNYYNILGEQQWA